MGTSLLSTHSVSPSFVCSSILDTTEPSLLDQLGHPSDYARSLRGHIEPLKSPENPPSIHVNDLRDLATLAFSCYGKLGKGKIALYKEESSARDGPPKVYVVIAGTEFDFTGKKTNTPISWLTVASGARSTIEWQVGAALSSAFNAGLLSADTELVLVGHSLGGMVAQNLVAGDPNYGTTSGSIRLHDSMVALKISDVVAFGAPDMLNRGHTRITICNFPCDPVSNLPRGKHRTYNLASLEYNPQFPDQFTSIEVPISLTSLDLTGGHLKYSKSGSPLEGMDLPPALKGLGTLNLVAAYANPLREDQEVEYFDNPTLSRIVSLIPGYESLPLAVKQEILQGCCDFLKVYIGKKTSKLAFQNSCEPDKTELKPNSLATENLDYYEIAPSNRLQNSSSQRWNSLDRISASSRFVSNASTMVLSGLNGFTLPFRGVRAIVNVAGPILLEHFRMALTAAKATA